MERNEVIADVVVQFVEPQLPGVDRYLVLNITKGKMPICLTREQARDLAYLILEEFE